VAALSGVAGPLAAGASAALATAVHLAGFFRQDTQYHGRKVTVTDRALVAELARLVNARPDTTFRWPHLGISERLFEDTEAVPSFLTAFQAATAAQSRAAVAVTDLAIAAQSLDEKDPRLQAARLALDRAHELLDSGSDILDSIRDALYSPDESGETLLQRLQLATDVAADVAANPSERFFLRIWVEAAGGSYRVRKSLWGSLLARDGLGFSGGVIVTFALLDHSGKLLTSGILTQRRAFTGFEQLSSQLE
jgi:hypothetical protein